MSKMSQLHHDTAPQRAEDAEREVARLTEENARLRKQIDRLKGTVDILCSPPMTIEEAEAAYDDLPDLSPEDKAAMEGIDINKIIKAASDPNNASGEWMVDRMIATAEACPGFDPETLKVAQSWVKHKLCL